MHIDQKEIFLQRIYFMLFPLTRNIRYLFFVWAPMFFSACVTMRNCPIETLQPANLTFEGPKNNIAICASQTILDEAIASNAGAANVPADSLLANILFSLEHLWEGAPGYENAQFFTYITQADEQLGVSNFDMVLQLSSLQANNSYFGQQYGFEIWEAYLYVQYVAKWTVYNTLGTMIAEYTDRDVMMWSSDLQEGKQEAVENLPDIKDAWWDMGIAIAQKCAVRMTPRWQTGIRNIYMINKYPELSQRAYTAMQNDAHARAFDIWENMLLSCRKNWQKKMKSRITYNMAVAYEFQNQLDQAIHWAQRSASLNTSSRTVAYLKLLRERQQQEKQLDVQTSQ